MTFGESPEPPECPECGAKANDVETLTDGDGNRITTLRLTCPNGHEWEKEPD